jgi:hypothetical protein
MNTIEEILWNYIDGNCTADEQKVIQTLIAEDESYRLKYQELLNLNNDFAAMDMDEPSMAFTYNVMEAVRTEHAKVPLKAAVNKRIIWGIAIFFTVTLLGLLVFTFVSIKWTSQTLPVNMTASFKTPDFNFLKAKPLVEGFLFFDVILGLYLLDGYFRKKVRLKQV